MTEPSADAWRPPLELNSQGQPRRVGVELEFSGVTHGATTRAVAGWANREAARHSLVDAVVEHPELGPFKIEVDWRYLKETAHEQHISEGSEAWVKLLRQAARLVVPVEVVGPPIPLTELFRLESLIHRLRLAGAQGTGSPIAAYGVHLNPEVPELSATAVLPYIQAFALLQWWLEEQHQVDVTRRLSPYVDLYPDAYLHQVLSYREAPDMKQLILDYYTHNPTRNRALDLWPLFAAYAPEQVESLMHEPLIKARPAFHYRLPNCEIDRESWRLLAEWERWLIVERLAADHDSRQRLISMFFSVKRPWLGVSKRHWIETIERWLRDRS